MAVEIIFSAFAAEEDLSSYAFRTSEERNKLYITAGIRYGTSVKKNYSISAPYGFVVGVANIPRAVDRSFEPLFRLSATAINISSDENLTVTPTSCKIAASASAADIGAYNVELTLARGNIWKDLNDLERRYTTVYGYVFPAYTDGTRSVRIGAFPTESEALAAKNALLARGVGKTYTVSVSYPAEDGITVLNSDFSDILFEFRGVGDALPGFAAGQLDGAATAYLCNGDTQYLYDGVFTYRYYEKDQTKGFSLINFVGLNEYIEGVIPTEFLNTWPLETLKAAAVTINCYTLSGIGKRYPTYGFDLTCSTSDQNYFGRRKVTQVCIDSASAVEGIAMTHKGSLITGYYGTSNGGWAVASNVAWVGSRGYLTTHQTPWEKYASPSIKNGMWQKEYTPEELCRTITNYRSGLTGTRITGITTKNVSDDCPYVYTLTVTDNKGSTQKFEHTATVAKAVNVYSGNFVIGKGSVDCWYDEVLDTQIIPLGTNAEPNVSVMTASGNFLSPFASFFFRTMDGVASSDRSPVLHVQTANGIAALGAPGELPTQTEPDKNGDFTTVNNFGSFAVVCKLHRVYQTITASSPNNYVIFGKGNGHGVGVSQVGLVYLAYAGADYEQSLRAYYNDIEFVNAFEYLASKSK